MKPPAERVGFRFRLSEDGEGQRRRLRGVRSDRVPRLQRDRAGDMTTVDPEDSIARLWAVLRCSDGQIVHQCWGQPHDGTELRALDGDIELALDEIERLQTENARLLDLLTTTTLALTQAGGR